MLPSVPTAGFGYDRGAVVVAAHQGALGMPGATSRLTTIPLPPRALQTAMAVSPPVKISPIRPIEGHARATILPRL